MLADHHEYDVVITAVASVGLAVEADGREGFIDQVKHPSWWGRTAPARVGDCMRAVVVDASRTPPRLSALPDDIMIAQSLRHTEPLLRACPPPRGAGRNVDWVPVEDALGTALPADYKRLVQAYGGGVFAGTIWLLEPGCTDEMYDLLAQTTQRRQILADLWAVGEDKPAELQEDGAGLVPWGYCESGGEVLYWLTRPGERPEQWSVLLNEGRGPLWEAHSGSTCSRFLLEVVTGTTASFYFADLDDLVDATDRSRFAPNAEILGR